MSHINVYHPKRAQFVPIRDPADLCFVQLTDQVGSTINIWLPRDAGEAVADAINAALAPLSEAAA